MLSIDDRTNANKSKMVALYTADSDASDNNNVYTLAFAIYWRKQCQRQTGNGMMMIINLNQQKITFPHRESNPGRGGESAES